MKLRAYQTDAIAGCLDALRRCRVEARPPRVLGVMPTGTGKTVTFMTLAKQYADAGHRVLVLAHRRELLEQAQRKGLALGIPAAWMAFEQAQRAETTGETRIVLSTVPSMRTRLARFPADFFRLAIHDEAHRVLAETHRALVDHFAEALLLGWTATPNRGDERALGQVFTEVGFDFTLGDALAAGWLVPPDVRTIETSRDLSSIRTRNGELMAGDVGAVLSELELMREEIGQALRHAGDKKAIVYCVTRAHMRVAAECAREMAFERNVDLRVMQVDGDTDDGERDQILADFLRAPTGRGCWLLNVEVATEGFDVPDTEAIVVLRPTMSRALYMQMIGRGLRPLDGLVDGVNAEEMLVRLDMAELGGRDLEHLAMHRLALAGEGGDALARRVAIATSAKPTCLVLDFAGNAGRHELANPLDLLGGDFDPVERREAQRLVVSGSAPNLWAALEQARLARAAKVVERQARAGDPFALFGLQVPTRSRFAAAPSSKQRAVIDALRQPRVIDDAREADVLVRELARRERADLALYSQAALLAAVGFDLLRLRTMSRREAAEHVRALASGGWRRQSTSHSAGHSVRR